MANQSIVDRIREGDLSDLKGAYLYKADLSGADLKGADLSGADLEKTNLSNIRYDKATKFPEGFPRTAQICKTAFLELARQDPAQAYDILERIGGSVRR